MVDLAKRTESAGNAMISLMKQEAEKGVDLGEITAQVVLVMDYSQSMEWDNRYSNGEVQDLVERALAASLAGLDDDGSIQFVPFHHSIVGNVEEITQANYIGFVDRWRKGKDMGGTSYLAAIDKVLLMFEPQAGGYIPMRNKKSLLDPTKPTLVLFVTDGETRDKHLVQNRIKQISSRPIFWQFLGLGKKTDFLKILDDIPGRTVDNVGFTSMALSTQFTDEQFYNNVLKEFITEWWMNSKAAGVRS